MSLLPFIKGHLRRCGVLDKDVADLAQEVVLQVLPWWARRAATEPDTPLGVACAYLRVTAIHIAVRHREREARRAECLGWEPEWSEGASSHGAALSEPFPCMEDMCLELEVAVEQATEVDAARLSGAVDPACWRALYAHIVDAIPVKEIAAAEGAPVATIYGRIRQARADLRAAIQRYRATKRPR